MTKRTPGSLAALVAFCAIGAYAAIVVLIALTDGAYRSLLRQRAAAIAIADASTPEARAEKILEYVVVNTPIPVDGVPDDPEFPGVIDDSAWGTLIRGRAFCDSQAMAVVQLLEDAGLQGQVLFLRQEDGVSPHTVATVLIGGRWMILDPLNGALPRNARGQWLSRDEMAASARADRSLGYATSTVRLKQGYAESFVSASWFINAAPFYETQANRASTSRVRRAIDAFLGTFQPVIWPGVRMVEDLVVTVPRYLSNNPRPGDVQYERARRDLLLNDVASAAQHFDEARDLGTQWANRIRPALTRTPFTVRDLYVPLNRQGAIPAVHRAGQSAAGGL